MGKCVSYIQANRYKNTEGNKRGGHGGPLSILGGHHACDLLFPSRNHSELEHTLWNLTEDKRQMWVGCLNCTSLLFKELHIVLKFKCPLTNREIVSRSKQKGKFKCHRSIKSAEDLCTELSRKLRKS